MPSVKPPALKQGDQIRIVSPASPIERATVDVAVDLLEAEGYRVSFGQHCFDADAYLAGADAHRAQDLMSAFLDPEVAAIYCSRGGYGCARLMPHLNLDAMAASNKLFLGFSDVTTLHIALNQRGLPTVHAPMGITLSKQREPWVYESFRNVLKGWDPIPFDSAKGKTLVGGKAEGVVTGGCLCLLTDSIGTPDPIDFEGKLVIIEDVDENPHRVDAMLTHLLLTGDLAKASGLIFGEMTRTDEKQDEGIGGRPWREIVRDRVENLGVPTVLDFPFGHNANMLSLPLGIRAEFNADAGTLTYLESVCA
jgi:muramoyltetrapeptide carboxypeptidase